MINNIPYYEKVKHENVAIKYAVACEAFKKCKPKDSVFIDAGTSLTPIAELFVAISSLFPNQVYNTILTNNYIAFKTLIDNLPSDTHINIMLTGGRYDRNLKALYGPQAKKSLDSFYPAVVFIGLSGFIAEIGLFCQGNTEELDMKNVIFKKLTRDRVILADSSKVGRVDSMCFGISPLYKANTSGDTYLFCDKPKSNHLISRFSREMRILKDIFEVNTEDVKESTIRLCHKYFTKTRIFSKSTIAEGYDNTLSFDFYSGFIASGKTADRSKCVITYNYQFDEPEFFQNNYVDIFSSDDDDIPVTEFTEWKKGNENIDKYVDKINIKFKEAPFTDEVSKHKDKKITYLVIHSISTEFQPFIIKKENENSDLNLLFNTNFEIEAHEDWWARLIKYRDELVKNLTDNERDNAIILNKDFKELLTFSLDIIPL